MLLTSENGGIVFQEGAKKSLEWGEFITTRGPPEHLSQALHLHLIAFIKTCLRGHECGGETLNKTLTDDRSVSPQNLEISRKPDGRGSAKKWPQGRLMVC